MKDCHRFLNNKRYALIKIKDGTGSNLTKLYKIDIGNYELAIINCPKTFLNNLKLKMH